VPRNRDEGISWMRLAANQGMPVAQARLAGLSTIDNGPAAAQPSK
jgi:TPR repeat protein